MSDVTDTYSLFKSMCFYAFLHSSIFNEKNKSIGYYHNAENYHGLVFP